MDQQTRQWPNRRSDWAALLVFVVAVLVGVPLLAFAACVPLAVSGIRWYRTLPT